MNFLKKFFTTNNILKILIIFAFGFSTRFLINHFTGINVFKEFWSFLSLTYYFFFSAFIVYINDTIDSLKINSVSSLLNPINIGKNINELSKKLSYLIPSDIVEDSKEGKDNEIKSVLFTNFEDFKSKSHSGRAGRKFQYNYGSENYEYGRRTHNTNKQNNSSIDRTRKSSREVPTVNVTPVERERDLSRRGDSIDTSINIERRGNNNLRENSTVRSNRNVPDSTEIIRRDRSELSSRQPVARDIELAQDVSRRNMRELNSRTRDSVVYNGTLRSIKDDLSYKRGGGGEEVPTSRKKDYKAAYLNPMTIGKDTEGKEVLYLPITNVSYLGINKNYNVTPSSSNADSLDLSSRRNQVLSNLYNTNEEYDVPKSNAKLGFKFANNKIESIYIRCYDGSRRRLFWTLWERNTGNYNSYKDFKASWDPNRSVWEDIRKELKQDISSTIRELINKKDPFRVNRVEDLSKNRARIRTIDRKK